MLIRILEIVFPIFAVVTVGVIYGRYRKPAMDVANRINLDIFVPALVFSALTDQDFDLAAYGKLLLGGAAIILSSGFAVWLLARTSTVKFRTLAPPMMFRNAGNMGLPLIVLAFGEAALPAALVLFLLGNIAHFGLGISILDRHARLLSLLRQPVILAAIAALVIGFSGMSLPEPIALPIDLLGQVAIPLMLFSLGVRLTDADLSEWRIGLTGALAAPLIGMAIVIPLLAILDLPPLQAGALFLFAALPPAVLNFLFAERYDQEPAKVASIVMLGHLAALVTIPLALAYALPRFG